MPPRPPRWPITGAVAVVTSFALIGVAPIAAEAAPNSSGDGAVQMASRVAAAPLQTQAAAKKAPTELRAATFNVRTSRADRGTSRHWLRRALSVAREIKSRNPGVVALQELGPGRADGKTGKINGALRQTESLEKALKSVGAKKYQLVRTTSYRKPGRAGGTQGGRLLYDTSRYKLVTKCKETTGKSNWNASCSVKLPILSSDGESRRRLGGWAEFKDKRTGQRFYVVSVHLDERHSGSLAKEKRLDRLRRSQAAAAYRKVKALNKNGYPVIVAGDINSWRTKRGSHAPHNYLTSQGFKDAVTAKSRIDSRYPTVNHWKRTLKANAPGRQVGLDVVMVKGASSFKHYENVMKVVDSSRASDHNLVISDVRI